MSKKIIFSDQRCSNITSDNDEYWKGAPAENCDDRPYCHGEAKQFVIDSKITEDNYLYHADKTVCYAETYIRHLFKINELIDQQ